MITCPHCSASAYNGALFCPACGGALAPSAQAHVEAARPAPAKRSVAKVARPATEAKRTRRFSLAKLESGGDPARLRLTIGGEERTLSVPPTGTIQIGRGDAAGFQPELDLEPFEGFERGVSRRHATIQNFKQGLVLIDQSSSNGTWLNDRLLAAGYAYLLPPRANVRFGDLLVYLQIED